MNEPVMSISQLTQELNIAESTARILYDAINDVCTDTTTSVGIQASSQNESTESQIQVNLIPPTNDTTLRFSSAIWYEAIQRQNIILAGLGGIGSYVAFLLARMNPASLWTYDDDRVEAVNLSGQLYSKESIGKYKSDSCATLATDFSDYHNVTSCNEKYSSSSPTANIMICGFDNMNARRVFFSKWCEHLKTVSEETRKQCLFIDGRLAAEEFQVFAIQGDDEYNINRYKNEFLFSDTEADETICSYKQTSFCANMIASVMVNCFVNFIANQCNPVIPRDVPFFTRYDASLMLFSNKI